MQLWQRLTLIQRNSCTSASALDDTGAHGVANWQGSARHCTTRIIEQLAPVQTLFLPSNCPGNRLKRRNPSGCASNVLAASYCIFTRRVAASIGKGISQALTQAALLVVAASTGRQRR